jgi:hypothetical protein
MKPSLLLLIPGACLCFATSADAKRAAPRAVPPVIRDGIAYSAPPDRVGHVVATWAKTGREFWSRQVYAIKYRRGLEQDVQWVFINDLRFEGGKLKVGNEKGGEFELDPESLNVKVLRGSAVIDFTRFKRE